MGVEIITVYVFAANGSEYIIRWCPEELRDNRELIHVCKFTQISGHRDVDWMNIRRTVLSGKERLALEHLSENAPGAPNVNRNIVLLPCEHGFGGPIIPRRHVASHLRFLYSGETKITDLGCGAVGQRRAERWRVPHFEIAILIDKDVAWFLSYKNETRKRGQSQPGAYKIAVDDASGM